MKVPGPDSTFSDQTLHGAGELGDEGAWGTSFQSGESESVGSAHAQAFAGVGGDVATVFFRGIWLEQHRDGLEVFFLSRQQPLVIYFFLHPWYF